MEKFENTVRKLDAEYGYFFKYFRLEELDESASLELERLLSGEGVPFWGMHENRFNGWIVLSQILKHHKIFIPHYTALNDPFECIINVDYSGGASEEVISDLHKSHLKEAEKNEQLKRRLDEIGGVQNFARMYEQAALNRHCGCYAPHLNEGVALPFGVYSFTEDPVNIQMWSHYADRHKGVCCVFKVLWHKIIADLPQKTQSDSNLLDILSRDGFQFAMDVYQCGFQKVKYFPKVQTCSAEERAKAHFDEYSQKEISWKISEAKYDAWAHEKEWRLVFFNRYSENAEDLLSLSKETWFIEPRAIILGARMGRVAEKVVHKCFKGEYPIIQLRPKINGVGAYAFSESKESIIDCMKERFPQD